MASRSALKLCLKNNADKAKKITDWIPLLRTESALIVLHRFQNLIASFRTAFLACDSVNQ
jgi:hypothetical protein